MDLIVRNVRLAGNSVGPVDIGVADGIIVAIEPGLAGEAETYDAGESNFRGSAAAAQPPEDDIPF